MNFEVRYENNIVIVKPLSKNIDASLSTDFKGSMIDLIDQGNNFFLLDLSQVDFIDSSGLGAIISILKTLSQNDGDIVICGTNPPILNLFKLTRMDQVFKIYTDEEEALTALTNEKSI